MIASFAPLLLRVWDSKTMHGPFGPDRLDAAGRALTVDRSTFPQYDPCPEPNPAAVLMQYTGRDTWNGTRIFQHDIVDCPPYGRGYVDWAFGECSWCVFLPPDDSSGGKRRIAPLFMAREVFGNVHEHPHLRPA